MTQIPIAGLVVLGILTLLGTAIFLDTRSWKKRELNDLLVLEKEKAKPKYKLVAKAMDGITSFESKPIGPYQIATGSDWCRTFSSFAVAKMHLSDTYEQGYFNDKDGVTYPVCNIQSIHVVQVD